jgi:hypothetical protein
MKAATVCVAVVALVAIAGAHAFCHEFNETKVPGCKLKVKGCRTGQYAFHATMTDPTTGAVGESDGTQQTVILAGQQAVFNLFQKDLGCNCREMQDVHLLTNCSLSFKACFFWNTIRDLQKGTKNATGWKFFVQNIHPHKSAVLNATALDGSKQQIDAAIVHLLEGMEKFGCMHQNATAAVEGMVSNLIA